MSGRLGGRSDRRDGKSRRSSRTRAYRPVSVRQTRRAGQLVAVTGTACAVVAAAAVGWAGLAAGLFGTLAVLAFFSAGLAPLRLAGLWGERPGPGFAVLLTAFSVRLVALVVVLRVLVGAGAVDSGALGLTVVVCALAWVVGQAVVGLRAHDPLDVPARPRP